VKIEIPVSTCCIGSSIKQENMRDNTKW